MSPRASRPRFPPGYGISQDPAGLLAWEWAVERLADARNYWICSVRADGRPHAAPVWGLWHDDAVLFSTSPQSVKGRNLARDPRVTVHLESGDEVVILEGAVGHTSIDDAVADAYNTKYGFRPDPSDPSSLWLRLEPDVAYAWLESNYPNTATRFDFVVHVDNRKTT